MSFGGNTGEEQERRQLSLLGLVTGWHAHTVTLLHDSNRTHTGLHQPILRVLAPLNARKKRSDVVGPVLVSFHIHKQPCHCSTIIKRWCPKVASHTLCATCSRGCIVRAASTSLLHSCVRTVRVHWVSTADLLTLLTGPQTYSIESGTLLAADHARNSCATHHKFGTNPVCMEGKISVCRVDPFFTSLTCGRRCSCGTHGDSVIAEDCKC